MFIRKEMNDAVRPPNFSIDEVITVPLHQLRRRTIATAVARWSEISGNGTFID